MPKYAVLSGNSVTNIIVADDKEATEAALRCVLVEFTDDNPAYIDWTYDPETGKFIEPEVQETLTEE